MYQPNDRIVHLNRARRAIRAIALSLVIAGFGATAALADVCQYSNGRRTLGPCMQFENISSQYDLYCLHGPTSRTHKIIIRNGDSFTCNIPEDEHMSYIAKTKVKGHWSFHEYGCRDQQKHVRKLHFAGANGSAGEWQSECRTLQDSLRW